MKVYHILIGIILILAVCIVKFMFFSGYTEKNVEALVKKSQEVKNCSTEFKIVAHYNGLNQAVVGKTNVLYSKMEIEMQIVGIDIPIKYYIDKDKDEFIMTASNRAAVGKMSELSSDVNLSMIDESSTNLVKMLKSKDYKYTYIDLEEVHDKECIHFTIEKENGSEIIDNVYKEEYYIDKSKGSTEKAIYYSSGDVKYMEMENKVKYDVVKSIERPNTSGYTVIPFKSLYN